MINEYYNYRFKILEYRSLKELVIDKYQPNTLVNYIDKETIFTKIIT